MNIMLNNYCNLKCPYCFASCDPKAKQNMTEDDFAYAAKFVANSGQRDLKLLGGEPTLHPHFSDIVLNATRASVKMFDMVMVFSNGIAITEEMSKEIVHRNLFFLINLNGPNTIGKTAYDKTISNLATLAERYKFLGIEPQIALGINIFDPNQDTSYIVEAAKQLGLRRIRYSITVPQTSGQNITLDHYRQFIPMLMDFLESCFDNRMYTQIDCNNIPKCLFTQEQLVNLLLSGHDAATINGCRPVMDIRPNLDVSRCFVFEDKIKVNIRDFENAQQLDKYFRERIDFRAIKLPTFDECTDCQLFIKRKCRGGCLGYKPLVGIQ